MESDRIRDVAALVVPRVGRVDPTGGVALPYRLLDADGVEVTCVSEYLHDMLSNDASPGSLRSYCYELLAWFRFLWAVDVPWDRAGTAEARDFALWLKVTAKPARARRSEAPAPGSVNAVTGQRYPGARYAARTRRHARAAVRSFYEYHRQMHGRPLLNPFPKSADRGDADINAHHNPMRPFRRPARAAPYQPRQPRRVARGIPDELFNQLFAGLTSDRDRALIAFYISTAARASELLGVSQGLVNPADQLIGVIRKGTRALQWLPASADAFVWLRLFQRHLNRCIPRGPDEPLWWTLRDPVHPLTYDAMRMVFNRANMMLGSNWTLHDLRRTALKRMARDPHMSLADVQWVAGHAHITTTEIYLEPSQDEVVAQVLAHHARRADQPARPAPAAPGYRPEVLATLLGTGGRGGAER